MGHMSLALKRSEDSTWQQFGTQGWLGDTWGHLGTQQGQLGVWGCNGAKLGCSGDTSGQARDTLVCRGVVLGRKDFRDTKESRGAGTVAWDTTGM